MFEINTRELSVIPEYDEAALKPVQMKDLGLFIGLARVGGFIMGIATVWAFLQF